MLFGAAMIFALAQAAAPTAKAAPQPPTKATFEAQTRAFFQKLDANHDGKVDKAEAEKFRTATLAAQEARRKQTVANAFTKLDTNKDGSISRQEFEALDPPKTAAAGPNPWFVTNDIDKNGQVDLNEALAKAQRNFEALDKDNNGVLSAQEINAARGRRPAPKK